MDEVQAAHEDHQTQSKEKERIRANSKAEASKLSEEELLKQQEALFEQARQKYMQSQLQNQSQKQSPAQQIISPNPQALAETAQQTKTESAPIVNASAKATNVEENASSESLELSS